MTEEEAGHVAAMPRTNASAGKVKGTLLRIATVCLWIIASLELGLSVIFLLLRIEWWNGLRYAGAYEYVIVYGAILAGPVAFLATILRSRLAWPAILIQPAIIVLAELA